MGYAASYLAARAEGYSDGLSAAAGAAGTGGDPADPAEHIAGLNGQGGTMRSPDGRGVERVPQAHLWMVAGGEFIGRVGVRHALNARLRRWGGHIGYEVRPLYRGRGFGHRALALGIAHARGKGLHELLLTCDDGNAASAAIIERAGGVLADVGPHPLQPGRRSRRYWIRTEADTPEN